MATSPFQDAAKRRLTTLSEGQSPASPYIGQNWQPSYASEPMQEAQDNVALEWDEKIRALQRANERTQADFDRRSDIEKGYGDKYDTRLGDLYGALRQDLEGSQQKLGGIYDTGQENIGRFYDEAMRETQGVNQDIMSRLTSDWQRLGIQEAAPDATSRLMEDYGYFQGENRLGKAGRLSNMEQLQSEMQGVGQMGINSAIREGVQNRADLANVVLRDLGQLQIGAANAQHEFTGQQAGLEMDRAAALRQELGKVTGERYDRARQGRLDELAELMGLGGMDLQERQFQEGVKQSERAYGLDVLQLELQKRQLEAELQGTANPLEQMKLQAEIDNINARTADLMDPLKQQKTVAEIENLGARTAATGQTAKKYGAGEAGLQTWMGEPQPGLWDTSAGPRFRTAVQELINDAINRAKQPAEIGAGGGATDPYQTAINIINQTGGQWGTRITKEGLNRAGLRTAVGIFFGKAK